MNKSCRRCVQLLNKRIQESKHGHLYHFYSLAIPIPINLRIILVTDTPDSIFNSKAGSKAGVCRTMCEFSGKVQKAFHHSSLQTLLQWSASLPRSLPWYHPFSSCALITLSPSLLGRTCGNQPLSHVSEQPAIWNFKGMANWNLQKLLGIPFNKWC